MQNKQTRRGFLQTTAVGTSALLAGGVHSQLSAQESNSPNEKLNIGIVGAGGRGRGNTGGVAGENIAALCDIDANHLAGAKKRFPKASEYRDWRKVMEDKSLDAVVISTADHTHAPAAIAAMKAGKHVYCEKPLAHTVEEARLMRETYAKAKVATQMGTQIHATDNYRRVVELVRGGAIGKVQHAHVGAGDRSVRSIPTRRCSPSLRIWIGISGSAPPVIARSARASCRAI